MCCVGEEHEVDFDGSCEESIVDPVVMQNFPRCIAVGCRTILSGQGSGAQVFDICYLAFSGDRPQSALLVSLPVSVAEDR
jgi:hypothetical protein